MNFEHDYAEVPRSQIAQITSELRIRSATGWILVSVIALPDCLGLFWRRASTPDDDGKTPPQQEQQSSATETARLREIRAAAMAWSSIKRCEMLNCDMTDLKFLLALHPEKQWDATAKRWVK